jgi:hypothetical protein
MFWMTEDVMLYSGIEAFQTGFVETLAGPSALPPGQSVAILVVACWMAWIDARQGVIPDLVLGVLVGLAAARLSLFGGAALFGGLGVGLVGLLALRGLGLIARCGGMTPLGEGDVRLIASGTVLLGLPGATVLLVVAVLLLGGQGLARSLAAGRPWRHALTDPVRMGPHLAAGLVVASLVPALRW